MTVAAVPVVDAPDDDALGLPPFVAVSEACVPGTTLEPALLMPVDVPVFVLLVVLMGDPLCGSCARICPRISPSGKAVVCTLK